MTSAEDLASAARRVLPLIDLTSLGDNDTEADIIDLCAAASTDFGPVGAVCVWPRFVSLAVTSLGDGNIPVAAVANFPLGAPDIDLAVADAERIIAGGGTEVDVVYPWRTHAFGDTEIGKRLVAATKDAIAGRAVLKVILETGELGDPQLIRAVAEQSLAGGADFLKTSTGKTEHSATPEAAEVLLTLLADSQPSTAGVKISGGVKTVAQAAQYLDIADRLMGPAWVSPSTFRFGASSLLGDVLATLRQSSTTDGL